MSDQDRPKPQTLPYTEIEAGLNPAQRAELAALRAQVEHPSPDAARIRGHVDALRDTEAPHRQLVGQPRNPALDHDHHRRGTLVLVRA